MSNFLTADIDVCYARRLLKNRQDLLNSNEIMLVTLGGKNYSAADTERIVSLLNDVRATQARLETALAVLGFREDSEMISCHESQDLIDTVLALTQSADCEYCA